MISREFRTLFKRSKTMTHLLQIHSLILKTALDRDSNAISDFMTSACSISVEYARLVFDNLPITPPLYAWDTIIREYSKSKNPIEAVNLFLQLCKTGIRPGKFTFPFVAKACGRCLMIGEGGTMHSLILKMGFDSDVYIGNTLLIMYASCGAIGFSRQVFDEMAERNVVSWSSMIAAYVACNSAPDSLTVFHHMMLANVKPNSITLVSLLGACIRLGTLSLGQSIHSYITVNNIRLDVALGTALLEMYSKCGDIESALKVFSLMTDRNLQSCTIMISCLAAHGRGNDAISLFAQMEQNGLKPDSMSFSSILCACSHSHLVSEGQKYFHRMVNVYTISPTMEHYGCMVDMFGRAGMIKEAYELIKNMPMKPNTIILRSFLGACRNNGLALHIDENLSKLLLEVEPELGANYVLAANLSAVTGCWNDAAHLRAAMKEKGLKKVSGWSWMEANNGSKLKDIG